MTADQDLDNLKQDGELFTILKNKEFGEEVKTINFPEMLHGWTVRGDIS
jgi:hypothetical protein